MTDVQARRLVARYQDGDDTAGDRLYRAYGGLRHQCVNRINYPRRVLEREDMDAVAGRGFVRAMQTFNPGIGVQFKSWAYNVMRGEIRKYLRDSSDMIRIPAWFQEVAAQGDVGAQWHLSRLRSPWPLDIGDYDNLLRSPQPATDLELDALAAIASWPEKQRQAALCVLHGVSSSEYARMTGKSRQYQSLYFCTVKKRLRIALADYVEVR